MNATKSLNLATEINAVRKGMMCDHGHFHPDMSPSSVLTGALSLFLFADKTAEWETPELRETMIKMIAQLAQEAREYVEEVVDGEVSTEELMELLDAPDEASLLVMARCIGMAPTIPGATGGIH